MKNKIFWVLSIFLLISSVLIIPVNAMNSREVLNSVDIDFSKEYGCSQEATISFEADKYHFSLDESICVSYKLLGDRGADSIDKIQYTQQGFEIINLSIDENDDKKIDIELRCNENYFESSLSVKVYLANFAPYELKIYAVKRECGVFISPSSMSHAYQMYMDYAKEIGIAQEKNIYTVEEINAIKGNSAQPSNVINGVEEYVASMATLPQIEGVITWVDDNNVHHPLMKARVEIYADSLDGLILLGSTRSAYDGSYSIDKPQISNILFENNEITLVYKIYADDGNVSVRKNTVDEAIYVYETTAETMASYTEWENLGTCANVAVYMNASLTNDLAGRAIQIFQALVVARDYAHAMMQSQPEATIAYYPIINKDYCFYDDSRKEIYITGLNPASSSLETYESWDLLMHEYGHHVQKMLESSYFLDNPHWTHYILASYYGKDIGMKLAWQESWPTVFALLAQNYHASLLGNINTVGNSSYEDFIPINFNLESETTNGGETCEASIMAVLWDLFDSTNDSNDTISLGHTAFWSVTTESQAKTFSEFIDYFYQQYPGYIDDIGANLSYYGMATSVPALDSSVAPSQTTPPKFTWIAQGGSTTYPNDRFELIVYDKRGNEIFRSGVLNTTSYTLTADQWHDVLYSYGSTYKVAVSVIQTGTPASGYTATVGPQTGPYISEVATFSKPAASPLTYTGTIPANATGKLKEISESLQPGQYMNYKVTFASTSRRIVQTFGKEDTYVYIYDSTGTLVASNDDGGYNSNAFLNYYFQKDQQYTIRVKFYSADETGEFKLSITPATTMKNSSSASLSSYESIYSISNSNSGSLTVSLYPHNTTILTFTPSVTGNYTFTINSSLDTYIYVIDPRSAEPVIRNGDFNDDDGEGQNPLLTKRLEAGVPYYIIVSTYNPSTMTSPTTVTLVYSKEN